MPNAKLDTQSCMKLKLYQILTPFVLFQIVFFSCSTSKKSEEKRIDSSYVTYLSSVVNDTVFFELPELVVNDSTIFPILDSAILLSKQCRYFDPNTSYLYSFRFSIVPNDKSSFLLDAHLSPSSAIGLPLVKAGILKQVENVAVFFYKHFLFVVPIGNYRGQKDLEYFPFVMNSGNKLKIRAPELFNEKVYSSYLTFEKSGDFYKIKDNKICGLQILIQ